MLGKKSVPSGVIFAGMLGPRNPLDAADRDDVRALIEVGGRLRGECPITIKKQPSRRDLLEMQDHRVEDRSRPRRVGDDSILPGSVVPAHFQGVLPLLDIGKISAVETVSFESMHQRKVAGAWLRIETDPTQVWNQRQHRSRRGVVVIVGTAREITPFAHRSPPRIDCSRGAAHARAWRSPGRGTTEPS
jgi:hypothetical protein